MAKTVEVVLLKTNKYIAYCKKHGILGEYSDKFDAEYTTNKHLLENLDCRDEKRANI